jgi:hypothetical protein
MSEPKKDPGEVTFSSEDSLIYVFDGPGDTTRRPRRPNNPREWPPPPKPLQEPQLPTDQPPQPESGGE